MTGDAASPLTATAWETFADYLASELVGPPLLVGRASDGLVVHGRIDWLYRKGQTPASQPIHHMLGVPLEGGHTDVPVELRLDRRPNVDQDIMVDSDASEATVAAILATPGVSPTLRALLAISAAEVIYPDSLRVLVSEQQYHDAPRAQQRIELLAQLRRELMASRRTALVPAPSRIVPKLVIAVAAAIGLVAFASCQHDAQLASNPQLLSEDALYVGYATGGLVWLAGTCLAALVVYGRKRWHKDVAIASTALGMLFLAGREHAVLLNMENDTGAPIARQVTVTKRKAAKGGVVYFEVTTPWRQSLWPMQLGVPKVRGGESVAIGEAKAGTLTTRPGWLGSEWVVGAAVK